MEWQLLTTAVVILGAVGYAGWRFYDSVREGGDPCKNCELKENCQKNRPKNNHHTCHCK